MAATPSSAAQLLCVLALTWAGLGTAPPICAQSGTDHIFVYVDASVPGPGSGTLRDPFRTLADAMAYVIPHDYVFVAPGTYREVLDIPFFIYVRSLEGPERTVIDTTGLGSSHAVRVAPIGELSGFTVRNGDGIGVLIEEDQSGPDAPEFGRIIRRNRITGCAGAALVMRGQVHPVTVENTLLDNGGAGLVLEGGASPWFASNTVVGHSVGIDARSGFPDAAAGFLNLLLWDNRDSVLGLTPVDLGRSLVGDARFAAQGGHLSADPRFRDRAGGDLRLAADSPARDAGDTAAVYASSAYDARGFGHPRIFDGDADGTPEVDLGSHEGGGLATTRRPAANGNEHLEIEILGAPGERFTLALGQQTELVLPIPNVRGALHLDAGGLLLLGGNTFDATGRATWRLTLPPWTGAPVEPTLLALIGARTANARLSNIEAIPLGF